MATVEQSLVTLPINGIVPYWRNPRNATEADIAKVMRSITEFGYQSPIVVDADHVIIAGHVRYLALRRLGWEEVPVLVSDLTAQQAKEYRIVDNRVGEFTAWDHEKLVAELATFTDKGVIGAFFPELELDYRNQEDEEEAKAPLAPLPEWTPPPARSCTCPHCYHVFELEPVGA